MEETGLSPTGQRKEDGAFIKGGRYKACFGGACMLGENITTQIARGTRIGSALDLEEKKAGGARAASTEFFLGKGDGSEDSVRDECA